MAAPNDEQKNTPDWCRCDKCRRTLDSCCLSLEEKEDEDECITLHDEFYNSCLNLENIRKDIPNLEEVGQMDDSGKRKVYRRVAYQRFDRWCWGGNMKPIPSCVVLRIRQEFSDPTGSQDAKLPLPQKIECYAVNLERPLEDRAPNDEQNTPDWCRCDKCRRTLDSCCFSLEGRKHPQRCITHQTEFQNSCLNLNNIKQKITNLEEVDQMDDSGKRKVYRCVAYQSFVHWRKGSLGRNIREPNPSCVVLHIRQKFPDPKGNYVGYQDAE